MNLKKVHFTVDIHSSNDAFQSDPRAEVQRIVGVVHKLIRKNLIDGHVRSLYDPSGNRVGSVTLTIEGSDL